MTMKAAVVDHNANASKLVAIERTISRRIRISRMRDGSAFGVTLDPHRWWQEQHAWHASGRRSAGGS
jgi:hypothetical protein